MTSISNSKIRLKIDKERKKEYEHVGSWPKEVTWVGVGIWHTFCRTNKNIAMTLGIPSDFAIMLGVGLIHSNSFWLGTEKLANALLKKVY